MNSFEARFEQTEDRYNKRKRPRRARRRNLEKLGHGGDWRKVDEPGRVMKRLLDLGLTDVAGEAAAIITDDGPDPVVLERIINGNQLLGADFFIRGAMASRSVGRVVVRDPSGTILGFGTGSLVTPQLLMTNNHVLDTASTALPSSVQFDFVERQGQLLPFQEYVLRPDLFFATDELLDFAVVAVGAVSSAGVALKGRPWSPLFADSGKAVVGERLNIVQHPAGRPQELSIRDNKIVDVFDHLLHYSSDTERGSSGSPAFNDQWVTTALHHSGVPKRNDAGQIVLINGEPWDGSADSIPLIAWVANEGIRISSIVAHLRDRADTFTGQGRELLEELFAAESPPLDPAEPATDERRADDEPTPDTLPGPGGLQGRLDADGTMHWVLPVQISAGLNSAPSGVLMGDGAAAATQPAPTEQPATSSEDDLASLALDAAALARALARLAETTNRPYLNEEENAAARDAYYQDISDDLDGGELFHRLSELVTSTHHTKLSYKAARLEHLYPSVDLRPPPDLNLASVYSGVGFAPEELIRNEVTIEAQREVMIRRFTTSESFSGEASLNEFLEHLETLAAFNCEHVVPQSWFNKQDPMKSDLHHLFTCEPGCNSFRSNIPYFQFGPEDEVVRNDCGRREDAKFEPQLGKGAAARATLYFLLRYPGLIGDEQRELGRERLDTVLLRWHEDHPPDDWEQHRNAEIAKVQGNRNPLIDHADWSSRIDFLPGFGN